MADEDQVLFAAEVEHFAAHEVENGKAGFYYRLTSDDQWIGPEETLDAAVEKIHEMLKEAATSFVKQVLNLE